MEIRIAAALLLTALLVVSPVAIGDEAARGPEDPAAERADASVEHTALARYFRAMATEARSRVRLHEYMARSMHSGKKRAQLGARHCEKLAELYGAMAEEFDQLAELHDEEAKGER